MKPCVINVKNLSYVFADTYDLSYIANEKQGAYWAVVCKIYTDVVRPSLDKLITYSIMDAIDEDLAWTATPSRLDDILSSIEEHLIMPDQLKVLEFLVDELFFDIRQVGQQQLSRIIYELGGCEKEARDLFRWQIIQAKPIGGYKLLIVTNGGDYRIKTFHEMLSSGKISLGSGRIESNFEEAPKRSVKSEPPRQVIDTRPNIENVRREVLHAIINKLGNNKRATAYDSVKDLNYQSQEFDNLVYTPTISDIVIDTTEL